MTLQQGPVPVSGVFPVGVAFAPSGDWDSGNPAFAISRGSPGASLLTPGHDRRFPGMLFSPFHLSAQGSAIRSRDLSSRLCPLRGRYNAAPRGAATTATGHTARSARPLPSDHSPSRRRARQQASDGATGSGDCTTSISRPRDVCGVSGTHSHYHGHSRAPDRLHLAPARRC